MGSVSVRAADATVKEHQVKAAFIYNFLKFVEWPASRFEKTNSSIVIGVAGSSPISAALEAAVKERKINGRNIQVRAVHALDSARDTHLLFIPASEEQRTDEILPGLNGGVLTVGESAGFARRNGMINFVIEDDKVRFEINMDAAEHANLKVSAQLQKLAKSVRRKN